MTRMRWWWCLTTLAACGGDAGDPVPDRLPARPSAERSFTVETDTLWIAGAVASETTFVEPWYLAAGRGVVYVSDGARGLLAFDADGRRRTDRIAGSGLLGPTTVLRDGSVLLVRRADGALLVFDSAGRRTGYAPQPAVQDAQGLCALDARTLLVAGGADRLTRVDRGGGTPVPFPFPWIALRDGAGLLRQTALASDPGRAGCVVALVVGNEFAIVRSADSATFHRYVEAIEVPPVRRVVDTAGDRVTTTVSFARRVMAAGSVAVSDSLIFIAFGGETPRRVGLIDIYDLPTGTYRSSVRFGAPVRALAASDGVLYVLYVDSGVPALAALRPRIP